MNYIKLLFKHTSAEKKALISACLYDEDILGQEEFEDEVAIYFEEAIFNEVEFQAKYQALLGPFEKEILPHINWNAQWESNFEPIRIHQEVGVRASFHPPFEDVHYDLVITPKMSFGTGHHETTQMMITWMCEAEFTNKSVFDFGCGTGILAIFAAKKGATQVLGTDNDPWSVENAKENCIQNNCPDIQISDTPIEQVQGPFDIILANINLNILLAHLGHLSKLLKPKGKIFLSGILIDDLATMTECLNSLGFSVVGQKQEKNWLSLYAILS
ncbi:MAG: 50S ribosomal protein L11 methyltransferase [Chitinophagaceae bacterium]|nr:50S ribosomal protein L11 methyltransferase [Chitinophagaceae bacterium]